MSKTLIIYSSKYGFTKKYAYRLAEKLNADIIEDKDFKTIMIGEYLTLVFGGSLYAGRCSAAHLLAKHFEQIEDKKIVLFTCGLLDVSKESNILEISKSINKVIVPKVRDKIKIFHLRGGLDYNGLSFAHKMMVKMVHSLALKKTEDKLTDMERDVIECFGRQTDFSDMKMLEPMIQYCLAQ